MKQITQCSEELGHQNERLALHGQARTSSSGVPSSRGYPRGGEKAKTHRLQNEMSHPACLVGPSLGRLVGTHCLPRTHDSIHHRGELKVKSDKRISYQTTEKEPGLCQIMAGFKRNEFFLPGD